MYALVRSKLCSDHYVTEDRGVNLHLPRCEPRVRASAAANNTYIINKLLAWRKLVQPQGCGCIACRRLLSVAECAAGFHSPTSAQQSTATANPIFFILLCGSGLFRDYQQLSCTPVPTSWAATSVSKSSDNQASSPGQGRWQEYEQAPPATSSTVTTQTRRMRATMKQF